MSSVPQIRVVSAEVEVDGAYLITQRRAEASLPHLWEFPGGRVQEGESDSEALRRALKDRLGARASVGHCVLEVTHRYDGYTLTMVVYRCALHEAPQALRVQALRWVTAEDFGDYAFPGADQHTVDQLLHG